MHLDPARSSAASTARSNAALVQSTRASSKWSSKSRAASASSRPRRPASVARARARRPASSSAHHRARRRRPSPRAARVALRDAERRRASLARVAAVPRRPQSHQSLDVERDLERARVRARPRRAVVARERALDRVQPARARRARRRLVVVAASSSRARTSRHDAPASARQRRRLFERDLVVRAVRRVAVEQRLRVDDSRRRVVVRRRRAPRRARRAHSRAGCAHACAAALAIARALSATSRIARASHDGATPRIMRMTTKFEIVDDAIATARDARARAVDEITDLFVAAGCHRARFRDLGAARPRARRARVGGRARRTARSTASTPTRCEAATTTIGGEMRACEAIERALRAMGAPGALRAHQIRGLDADALLPTSAVVDTARAGDAGAANRGDAGVREAGVRAGTGGREALGTARTRTSGDAREAGAARRVRRAASVQSARRGREPPRENASRWAKSVMMEYGHKLAGLEAFASAATAVLAANRWKRRTRASKAAGTLRASDGGRGERRARRRW